jgi:DTW domain-containing protein YfiP
VEQLLVLDGTWAQARRMLYRVEALRDLPRLSLPVTSALPHIRRQPRAGAMSTFEAIARALQLLEGDVVADPLETLLRRWVTTLEEGRQVTRRGG